MNDAKQKEEIFRNYLIMLKPKYVYISYIYHCLLFDKFKNEIILEKKQKIITTKQKK